MYISGGFTDGHFSDAMLCYNPKHDIWERRTPMQNPRGWHQMVTVKGESNFTFLEDFQNFLVKNCKFSKFQISKIFEL